MAEFITSNLGTIVVLFILVTAVALIFCKLKKDKKQGRSSCGCKCSECPNSRYCHGTVQKNDG